MIDLRSDTVTRPGKAMKEFMFSAELGDDVFGEDPTVNELESKVAAMFGKEAGLFCPSGTMTNQIAIKVHTQPGDEVICDVHSHIYNFEGGGISFNSGAQARLLQGDEGRLSAELIEPAINAEQDWLTRSSLVSLENTVNRAGGSYYTVAQVKPIKVLCEKHKLSLHLDGARIFNALAATGESAKQTGELFDSVSVCLSKGLGTPAGSVLLGTAAFIKKARRVRKVFGGGMRQAGILAAAGIYALDHNVTRLKEDHRRAAVLGNEIKGLGYVATVLPVYTNIVIFSLNSKVMTGAAFEWAMRERGIRVSAFGKDTVRLVTHLDFDDDMLQRTVEALRSLNKSLH